MTAIKQPSFAAGEIAPSLYARTDQSRYSIALRTLRNFFVGKSGGAFNRPGTEFIAEVKDSTKTVRMIEFIFNNDQTYILEFGNLYMRVFRNGAPVEVSGVTAWNSGTAYVIGNLASRLGINYYCILGHTNQQPPNATYWYPLTGAIFEIPTPYLEADLPTLNYAQSADVIVIVHPTYAPRELARTAHTGWTLQTIVFAPSISAPTNLTNDGTPGSPVATFWSVTAVTIDGEESLEATTFSQDSPTGGSPINLDWTAVSGAVEYRVYRADLNDGASGGTGFIGSTTASDFEDDGSDPESAGFAPEDEDVFETTDNFPSTVMYSQQRLFLGSPNNDPERCWASRIGSFKNFTRKRFGEITDADSFNFRLVGRRVNKIQHILELRQLLFLTINSEVAINGDNAGIVTPTQVNAKQQTYNGSSSLQPLNLNGNALYVQARGSIIRDIGFDFQADGYGGNDLTIYSSHLFKGKTIVDWAYQQIPDSIVWAVRDDGVLLGLTYIREQEMLAWHRHDTDGEVENVCVVPEGNEDRLYLVVKRTVDGSVVRYIERMHSRQFSDIVDAVFMDSSLTYDGRNDDPTHTMTLSGGTTWSHTETLTLTSNQSFFSAGDVGNAIHLTGPDGTIIRFTINEYTSVTVVTGKAHKLVPAGMRSIAISDWTRAVDEVSGLDHLEGESVTVFADGFVVASPNNSAYAVKTVSGGSITLNRPYGVIHVGLPFLSDMQTLDIDTSGGESLADKKKLITKVSAFVESSRGIWTGANPPTDDDDDPLEGLREAKLRSTENYDEPTELKTEVVDVDIKSEWSKGGRVFIRQVDPLPLAILSVIPTGLIPFAGGR